MDPKTGRLGTGNLGEGTRVLGTGRTVDFNALHPLRAERGMGGSNGPGDAGDDLITQPSPAPSP